MLKNGWNSKFYVICILPQFLKYCENIFSQIQLLQASKSYQRCLPLVNDVYHKRWAASQGRGPWRTTDSPSGAWAPHVIVSPYTRFASTRYWQPNSLQLASSFGFSRKSFWCLLPFHLPAFGWLSFDNVLECYLALCLGKESPRSSSSVPLQAKNSLNFKSGVSPNSSPCMWGPTLISQEGRLRRDRWLGLSHA